MAKFKAKTTSLASWQRDFYDHQIRTYEPEEDYAFHVFMNPYVEGLCTLNETWPWWRRGRDIAYEFEERVADNRAVPSSWLKQEWKPHFKR